MNTSRITRIGAVTVTGSLALMLAVGVGSAAIPSANKTIHSCYSKDVGSAGALRVIDAEAGATCRANETPLSFNQQGLRGATGPAGPQGAPGTANVHWARIDAEGRMTAKSSDRVYTGWFDTGGYYFGVSSIDLTRCAISVTPDRRHPEAAPAAAEVYDTYAGYTMVYVKRYKPSVWPLAHERINAALYVSASCT